MTGLTLLNYPLAKSHDKLKGYMGLVECLGEDVAKTSF